MDRSVVDALNALPERTRFMKGLYAWVGFKGEALPYTPDERLHGNSRFSGLRLFRLALDGLTAFTTWPLRMVSLAGVVAALVGLCYAAYLVGNICCWATRSPAGPPSSLPCCSSPAST